MLNIPDLKGARFSLQLKEIAIQNALKLAKMPERLSEKQTTHLLNSIIEHVDGIESPRFWTVQERMFVTGHYIVATQDDEPDFEVGENARYSDYLRADLHYKHDEYDIGLHAEDHWKAIPLLGVMAETIEALEGVIEGIEGVTHWSLGCMACQLIPNDRLLDFHSPDYEQQVLDRMMTLMNFPESDFVFLLAQLNLAQAHFMHLFDIALTDQGIAAKPIEGGAGKPYARFPAYIAITTVSQQLCGKPELSSP